MGSEPDVGYLPAAGVDADTVTVSSCHPVPEWTFQPVPDPDPRQRWELTGLRELRQVRRAARDYLTDMGEDEDAVERAILVIDELASNAVRHGTPPATLFLCEHHAGWLVIASDGAPDRPPIPAVDRPAEKGGMGLYVVADLSTAHGTQCEESRKHVWAILART